jgi:C4-dicarboxylate-specific signal transduction histidine kinase
MTKYKYQIIVALIAIVVGGFIGFSFSSYSKNKEIEKLVEKHKQELTLAINEAKTRIQILDNELVKLDRVSKSDSIVIENLNKQIKQDGIRTEQKLKAINKLNSHEKVTFLLKRYSRDSIK